MRPRGPASEKPEGNTTTALGACTAAGVNNGRNPVGLGGDDGQIEALGNVLGTLVARYAEHRFVLGIHGEELSLESCFQHVADEDVAQGHFPFAGTDDGHGAGFEEGREVMLFVHDEYSAECVRAAIDLPLPRGRRSRMGSGGFYPAGVACA
jgi:hypothetical protein